MRGSEQCHGKGGSQLSTGCVSGVEGKVQRPYRWDAREKERRGGNRIWKKGGGLCGGSRCRFKAYPLNRRVTLNFHFKSWFSKLAIA